MEDVATAWARRVGAVLATCTTRCTIVVVVVASVVVVATGMVVPMSSLAVGETPFAMAGSAVVLKTIPATSEPIDPMSTERRGPRRDVEVRSSGSPESFCPCVILVMNQLSKINSKVLPIASQHLLNSVESPQTKYAIWVLRVFFRGHSKAHESAADESIAPMIGSVVTSNSGINDPKLRVEIYIERGSGTQQNRVSL